MRIKCPHCNGKGFSELNSALNMTCGWCMGQGELDLEIVPTEPLTEQEYLQTCDTKQLAKWLSSHSKFIYDCGQKQIIPKVMYEEDWEWWLKQPHKQGGKE